MFERHTCAMKREEVLFVEVCFAIDHLDLFVGFEFDQSDKFENCILIFMENGNMLEMGP